MHSLLIPNQVVMVVFIVIYKTTAVKSSCKEKKYPFLHINATVSELANSVQEKENSLRILRSARLSFYCMKGQAWIMKCKLCSGQKQSYAANSTSENI